MKKFSIWILLTITLVFAAFVAGIYMGRNFHYSDVQIYGNSNLTGSATPSASTSPKPTASHTLPSSNGATHPSGSPSTPSGSSTLPSSSATHPSSSPSTPSSSSTSVFPININTATVEELDLLPDIGPVLAERIVRYREEFGPYTCVEDLLYVYGIGETKLAKIREYITV